MASTSKKSTTKKTATKQGSKMGRPRIEIDENQFKKLCEYMCTLEEIAGIFNCSEDTIERWCKRTFDMTLRVTVDSLGVTSILLPCYL